VKSDYNALLQSWKNSGADTEKLWKDIKEIVVKSFLSVEQVLVHWAAKMVQKRSNAFELLGYDILVDENMKPWLLEINHTPSLAPHTALENRIKQAMLSDLFGLVDIDNKELSRLSNKVDQIMNLLQSLTPSSTSSPSPKSKQLPWGINGKIIPNRLSRVDIWTIFDTEFEFERRGSWVRCFPDTEAGQYMPYLQLYNRTKLLGLWMQQNLKSDEFF